MTEEQMDTTKNRKNFNILKRILFILIQCTWGLGATAIGFLYFLANIRCPHRFYRGAIETQWKNGMMGLSLGLFIFTPSCDYDNRHEVDNYN